MIERDPDHFIIEDVPRFRNLRTVKPISPLLRAWRMPAVRRTLVVLFVLALWELAARAADTPLLLPGVGAQGGSLEESVRAGLDGRGRGVIVSVSRGIAHAPEGSGQSAEILRERIEGVRAAVSPA